MAKHNWPVLFAQFLQGKYRTLEEMAKDTKISISMLRKRSASDDWFFKRAEVERMAVIEMQRNLASLVAKEAAKRIPGWFKMADVMKERAFEAWNGVKGKKAAKGRRAIKAKEPVELNASEALRAMKEAYNMEADILMPKVLRRDDSTGDPDNDGPNNGKTLEEDRRSALHSKLARLAAGAKKKADP